mmetsp:Transcript_24539/g.48142  ORF Transcript_24539/g.48142 Transcript_24539/m.48142 type:complete len:103 (-) Transcript_24539:217-525(-)
MAYCFNFTSLQTNLSVLRSDDEFMWVGKRCLSCVRALPVILFIHQHAVITNTHLYTISSFYPSFWLCVSACDQYRSSYSVRGRGRGQDQAGRKHRKRKRERR